MDYTKFLGKKEHVVLAYLGGAHVFGKDRRLRIAGERPAPGFHRFEVSGREARSLGPAEPPELGELSKARGHLVEGWLVSSSDGSTRLDRLSLLPEEQPPPLATARARRWHSGDLLFDVLDFDTEVEEEARLRLERLAPLADLKGVASTLRTAFGIALALVVSRRVATPLSVREAAGSATRIADLGEVAARELLVTVERERLAAQQRTWARALAAGRPLATIRGGPGHGTPRTRVVVPTIENAAERAEAALDGAHALMLAARRLGGGQLEVTFDFMGERFISVVDALSLQIIDSGVCLAGEDDLVTLDSLPGVIREAIQTDRLVITRR